MFQTTGSEGSPCKSRRRLRFRRAPRVFRTPSIDQPDMPMVMMIRADRPSSGLAKIVLRIFQGDTRMYHLLKEHIKRPCPVSNGTRR